MLEAMPWRYARMFVLGCCAPKTIRHLDFTSLGRYVAWMIRPLDDKSLERFALERYVLWTNVPWILHSSILRPIHRLLLWTVNDAQSALAVTLRSVSAALCPQGWAPFLSSFLCKVIVIFISEMSLGFGWWYWGEGSMWRIDRPREASSKN